MPRGSLAVSEPAKQGKKSTGIDHEFFGGVMMPMTLTKFSEAFNFTDDPTGIDIFRDFCKKALDAHPEFLQMRAVPIRQDRAAPVMQWKPIYRFIMSTNSNDAIILKRPTLSPEQYAKLEVHQIYARMAFRLEHLSTLADDDVEATPDRPRIDDIYYVDHNNPEDTKWMLMKYTIRHIGKCWNSAGCWKLTADENWNWVDRRVQAYLRANNLSSIHQQNQTGGNRRIKLKMSLRASPWLEASTESVPPDIKGLHRLIQRLFLLKSNQNTIDALYLIDDYARRILLHERNYQQLVVNNEGNVAKVSVYHTHKQSKDGEPAYEDAGGWYVLESHPAFHAFPAHDSPIEENIDDNLDLINLMDADFRGDTPWSSSPSEDQSAAVAQTEGVRETRHIPMKAVESSIADHVTRLNGQVDQSAMQNPKKRRPGAEFPAQNGEPHSNTIKVILADMVDKEDGVGGGIIIKSAGMDTSTLLTAMTEFGSVYRKTQALRSGRKPSKKATLIVVSSPSVEKTSIALHLDLGLEWRVFRYGKIEQTGADEEVIEIEIDPDEGFKFYSCDEFEDRSHHAVIITTDELGALFDKTPDLTVLENRFERIIIDDGHNFRGGERTRRGKALLAMKASFIWILTSSLLVHSLVDFRGYVALLPKAVRFGLGDDHLKVEEIDMTQTNPYIAGLPFDKRCLTTEAFDSFILPHIIAAEGNEDSNGNHLRTALNHLRVLQDKMVLNFSAQTVFMHADGTEHRAIPDIKVKHTLSHLIDLANDEERISACTLEKVLEDMSVDFEAVTAKSAFQEDAVEEVDGEPSMPRYNKSARAATAVGLLLDHTMFSHFLNLSSDDWVKLRNTSLTYLVFQMRRANAGQVRSVFPKDPYDSRYEVLHQFLFGAPKFRQALRHIRKIAGAGKIVVLTQYPQVVEVFHKMLRHTGISSVLLSSADSLEEHNAIVAQFNDDPSHPRVLSATFTDMAGVDVHHHCSNVICLDQPNSLVTLETATDCVHHHKQENEQTVLRYHISDTYMDAIEERLKRKGRNIAELLH